MESKPMSRVDSGCVVEDFEPLMDWVRDTGADTLRIHLPGFNKEQLKVQVTSTRVLKISGERQLSGNRWSTFRKEIPIASNYDTNEINARFDKGILYVKHPKVIVLETTMAETLAYDQNQAQEKAKSSLQVSSKSEQMSSAVEGKVGSPSDSDTETKKQPEDNLVGMEKQEGGIEKIEYRAPTLVTKEEQSVIYGWKDKSTKNAQVEAEAEGIATRSKSAKPENHVARAGMEKQEVGKIEREENDNFSSPKTPTKAKEPVINEWKDKSTKNAQVEAEAEGIATRSKSAKLENPDESSLGSTNTIKDKAEKGKLAMESYRKGFSVMDMKKSRTLVNLVLVILFILVLGMYGRNAIRSLKKSDN